MFWRFLYGRGRIGLFREVFYLDDFWFKSYFSDLFEVLILIVDYLKGIFVCLVVIVCVYFLCSLVLGI